MQGRALLYRCGAIAFLEVIVTLCLASLAPLLINSRYAIWGFVLWGGILTIWGWSLAWLGRRLWWLVRARSLFLRHFPQQRIGWLVFFGLSPRLLRSRIDHYETLQGDPDLQPFLTCDPGDLIQQSPRDSN